ncbi:MAG: L-threonylcarbamoyladenylate synthase [Bacteroidota bacterium]
MQNDLKNTLKILKNGGIFLYPTDTVWGIGCDATDENAVKKVFELKKRIESKSLIILVDSWDMLQQYINKIPPKANCILEGTSRPTSVIYENPKGLAKNVIANDHTVAIRIVKDDFCKQLINKFGKPIVSTSANYSGKPTPKNFNEIDKTLFDKVDYVVNLNREKKFGVSSQIVKIDEKGKIEFLRK